MLEAMVAPTARLDGAQVERLPYPHIVHDGVLTESELRECIAHWPDSDKISEESPGSGYKVLHLRGRPHRERLSAAQVEYWENFIETVCLPLVKEVFATYSPWIVQKFGDRIRQVELTTFALTEYENEKTMVGSHVHTHDPTWLFTNLIHVNDGDNQKAEERGNALFGLDGRDREDAYTNEIYSRLASVAPHDPIDGMRIQKDYAFSPGRLFSFFETPVSYHGSRTPTPGPKLTGRRLMIRMHASAPVELTQALYGVEYGEYRKMKYPPSPSDLDPRMIPWMKKDIHAMFAAGMGRPVPELLRGIEFKAPPFWG